MDEQRIQDRVSETAEKVGTMASDVAKQAGTARFTIIVTDSGVPVRESLSARFAITIAK